jgi:hypothetical protein
MVAILSNQFRLIKITIFESDVKAQTLFKTEG